MAVVSATSVSPRKKKPTSSVKNHEMKSAIKQNMSPLNINKNNEDRILEDSSPPGQGEASRVRVVGRLIYDSSNGKNCHQCRQKTLDFVAKCTNMKKNRPCTIKLCNNCLQNRYGEKAEDVASLVDWKCPKCRDICNCSFCMKKKGHQPTGILVHTAKASGFASVSELLNVKGPEMASQERALRAKTPTPEKFLLLKEKEVVPGAERSIGTENVGKDWDSNFPQQSSSPVRKSKKGKRKELADAEVNTDLPNTRSQEKFSVTKEMSINKEKDGGIDSALQSSSPMKKSKTGKRKELAETKADSYDQAFQPEEVATKMEIILPTGTEMTSVANADLISEDVGNALQFLEFCAVFEEVLEIRKGQPESALRDIMLGRNRRGKFSSLVRFQIQLLTMIQEDLGVQSTLSPTDGKDCWLHALKTYVSSAEYAQDLPDHCFDGTKGFESLSPSQKLKLVVFLCDEALGTTQLRSWIEQQQLKFTERKKEAKEKVNAAKDKEKAIEKKNTG